MAKKKESKEKPAKGVSDEKPKAEKGKSNRTVIGLSIAAIILLAGVIILYDQIFKTTEINKDIVARVNGEEITKEYFDKLYQQTKASYGEVPKEAVLNSTIYEALLVQEAKKQGISVPDEQVNSYVNNAISTMLDANGITEEKFKEILEQQNSSIDKLKEGYAESYRKRLMIEQLLNSILLNQSAVTDEEVSAYYEANKLTQFNAGEGEIRARHILVKTEVDAEDVLYDLQNTGASFEELAERWSEDTGSAQNGGLLYVNGRPFFGKGVMVKEFEDAAFALKENEISGIVKTQYGFHIIKRESNVMPFKEAEDQIKSMLKSEKQKGLLKGYMSLLYENAEIEIFEDNL